VKNKARGIKKECVSILLPVNLICSVLCPVCILVLVCFKGSTSVSYAFCIPMSLTKIDNIYLTRLIMI